MFTYSIRFQRFGVKVVWISMGPESKFPSGVFIAFSDAGLCIRIINWLECSPSIPVDFSYTIGR